MDLILGLPYLNQYDAAAADLRRLFTSRPDFRPYGMVPVQYVRGANERWLAASREIDFSRPDRDELKLRDAILASEGLPRRPK